jgi:hypothetical protein
MVTKQDLEAQLKQAMLSGEKLRRDTLRMLLTAIKLQEVERRGPLDEEAMQRVIQREVKARQESIADARKAGRAEMIKKLEQELEILQAYLPEQLSDEEIAGMAKEAIQAVGASGPAEMGKVMAVLMPRLRGRADGRRVSQIVRQLLQG